MAFYGDDFTGSSENLAQFHRSGLRSKLYLRLPTVEGLLQDAEEFHILGIAGTARAMNSDVMEGEIGPGLRASCQARLCVSPIQNLLYFRLFRNGR